MSYEPEVFRRATARLKERAQLQQRRQAQRRQEIYARLPRVQAINQQLRTTVIQVAAAALQAGTDPAPAIRVLRDQNMQLQQERRRLLNQAGYPDNALDDAPFCPKCGDTGWRGSQMCSCLRELCAQEQIRALSSLMDLGDQTFDTFDLSYYSAAPNPERGFSDRQNMEMVRDVCFAYADKFGKNILHNLLLTGGTGLGKTFLASCIARVVSERGYSVVYGSASTIFDAFDGQKFRNDPKSEEYVNRCLGCDLLILDDLGSEMTTPLVQASLYTLINSRLTSDRHTVISSNLNLPDLRKRYSPQVASRLEGEYRLLPFTGQDIRLLKQRRLH